MRQSPLRPTSSQGAHLLAVWRRGVLHARVRRMGGHPTLENSLKILTFHTLPQCVYYGLQTWVQGYDEIVNAYTWVECSDTHAHGWAWQAPRPMRYPFARRVPVGLPMSLRSVPRIAFADIAIR